MPPKLKAIESGDVPVTRANDSNADLSAIGCIPKVD